VDEETARTIIVRSPARRNGFAATGTAPLHIVPNGYNLGLSRPSTALGQGGSGSVLPPELRRIEAPDITAFGRSDKQAAADDDSRLAPRISLDERERAGRAPRTLEGIGEQSVNLGGSYRVTRNFDVTAGVRYSRDRDRLKPIVDGKSDNQSVFVGTQFRF